MSLGGGGAMVGGCSGLSVTGFIWETWNDGWTFIVDGSFSRTAVGLIILMMGKGPMNLGASFLGVSFS